MSENTWKDVRHYLWLTLKYTGVVLFVLVVPVLLMLGSICKSAAKHGESMYGGNDR